MIHWTWMILALVVGEITGIAATMICMNSKDEPNKSVNAEDERICLDGKKRKEH